MSIFTLDFPYLDFDKNVRMGYRLPIKVILPGYMLASPFYEDLFDAIDQVFDKKVYEKTDILSNLRNMWVSNPDVEQKIEDGQLINLDDWSLPERDIVGKQLNLLGLQLGESASLFSSTDFIALCRFLGRYWFEKGTNTFLSYINFCCNTHYTMSSMWTSDYKTFYVEGDERIGTPVWEGGEWYPTTHVQFVTSDGETNILALALLFYELANYNLVLDAINVEFNMNLMNGYGKKGLYLDARFDYHFTFKIKTYNPAKEEQKEMFGFEGTGRLGYDLSRYAEDDYDDSMQAVSGVTDLRPHAFYSLSVASLTMDYPVLRDAEGEMLETPVWKSALGGYGYCVDETLKTSDSYNLEWLVYQTGGSILQKYDDQDPFNIKGLFTVRNGLQSGYATYLLRDNKEKALIIERMDATGKSMTIEAGADYCLDSLFTNVDIGKQIMLKVTQEDV